MIRRGKASDLPAAVRMARDFHNGTPIAHLPFSAAAAAQMFNDMLSRSDCMVDVLEVDGTVCGCIIAHVQRYPLGASNIAREVVFWIDPDHRGAWARKMIEGFEAWAADKGAVLAGMSCFDDGRTYKLFERAGYRRSEVNLIKDL